MSGQLVRGTVLAQENVAKDAWLVVEVNKRSVIALDLCCFEAFKWWRWDDGIRVSVRVMPTKEDITDSQWNPIPITQNPPPDEIAAYLRREVAP